MLESFREQNFTKAVEQMQAEQNAAIELLQQAAETVNKAVHQLIKAEGKIPETPDGDRIASLYMDLENFISAITEQAERMK